MRMNNGFMIRLDLKINKEMASPYGRKRAGEIVTIECDSDRVPLDKFWRDRLKDSKIDDCVTLLVKEAKQERSIKEPIEFNRKKKNK